MLPEGGANHPGTVMTSARGTAGSTAAANCSTSKLAASPRTHIVTAVLVLLLLHVMLLICASLQAGSRVSPSHFVVQCAPPRSAALIWGSIMLSA